MRTTAKDTGNQDILREISLLIRSRYGLIWLKTAERDRMESLLWHVAESLGLDFFIWVPGEGMRRRGSVDPMYGTGDLKTALAQARAYEVPAVYCFHGIASYLADPVIEAKFVEAVRHFTKSDGVIVTTGLSLKGPPSPTRPLYRTGDRTPKNSGTW
jgi:hypothetical protein